MRSGPTRIVLVDDHAIMRQGLKAVLEREDDLRIVGEAGTPADAVATVAASRPHIVLLDLKLTAGPQTDGLDVCRRLTAAHPGLGVLVLTTFAEDRLVVESVQAGARGYVVKDVDTTELVRAIRAVSRGESAFDARSASAMVRSLSGGVPERERLTERELDVLRLLAHGLSNRAIGGENLSPWSKRVTSRVERLMRFEGDQILPGDELPPGDAGGLLLNAMNVAPELEAEFNEWYDKEHIPALGAVPGVLCARRFRGISGNRKYVALYHLAEPAVQESAAWKEARVSDWTTRLQPHFRDHLRIVCRRYARGR